MTQRLERLGNLWTSASSKDKCSVVRAPGKVTTVSRGDEPSALGWYQRTSMVVAWLSTACSDRTILRHRACPRASGCGAVVRAGVDTVGDACIDGYPVRGESPAMRPDSSAKTTRRARLLRRIRRMKRWVEVSRDTTDTPVIGISLVASGVYSSAGPSRLHWACPPMRARS